MSILSLIGLIAIIAAVRISIQLHKDTIELRKLRKK